MLELYEAKVSRTVLRGERRSNPPDLPDNSRLAKSIHDAGWSRIVQHTEYKAVEKGKTVEKVDPKNTSQLCSVCGKKKKTKLKLANRVFECEHCKSSLNRDINAAANILRKSKAYKDTVRLAGINGCGVGTTTTSCVTGLQVPTMNQQLLNLVQG